MPDFLEFLCSASEIDAGTVDAWKQRLILYEAEMSSILADLQSGSEYSGKMCAKSFLCAGESNRVLGIYPETPEILDRAVRIRELFRQIDGYRRAH